MSGREYESPAMSWYLVDTVAQSALRLVDGLVVGEAPSGALTLNDPDPECQWIEFHVAGSGTGPCVVRRRSNLVMVGAEGFGVERHPFGRGFTLSLPHNTVDVCQDISMSSRQGPVIEVFPAQAEHLDPSSPPDQAAPPLRALDPSLGDTSASGAALLRPHRPARHGPSAFERARPGLWLAGVLAVTLPVSAMLQGSALLEWLERRTEAMAVLREAEAPIPPAQPDSELLANAAAEPSLLPDGGDAKEPSATGRLPSTTRDDGTVRIDAGFHHDAEIERLLERARELLYEGDVTSPSGENAVAVLRVILGKASQHPQATGMLEQCSEQLVAAARAYHERGLKYEARNTLEEVFSFDPQHPEANRLWRQWVGSSR